MSDHTVPDDERHLAVPDPDVIRVSADDVLDGSEPEDLVAETIWGTSFFIDKEPQINYADWDKMTRRLGNLRTPEADAPVRYSDPHAEERARQQIGRSIKQVEDPSLRRALLEEYHR